MTVTFAQYPVLVTSAGRYDEASHSMFRNIAKADFIQNTIPGVHPARGGVRSAVMTWLTNEEPDPPSSEHVRASDP